MQRNQLALDDLLDQVRAVGEKPPRRLFDAVLAHGQDAVAPLIQVVLEYPDEDTYPDDDADPNAYWATYHAIRLLGELRAAEATEPILDLLDLDDDYVDRYLPRSLALIGQPAIEPLREALFAPDADLYGAARAANALEGMVEHYPELRSEVVHILTERLDADIPHDDEATLRGFLVSNLGHLRAVEAVPSVRRAFAEELVDESVIDLETFELLAERPERVSTSEALMPHIRKLEAAASPDESSLDPLMKSRRQQAFGRKVGRNEACPCGSTKKYKRCHGR